MKGFTEKDGVLVIIFANNLIYKRQKFQPSQTSPSVLPLEIAYLVQKLWNFWYQVKILVFLHHLQKEWVLFYLKWAWNECLHFRTSEMSIDMGRRIVQWGGRHGCHDGRHVGEGGGGQSHKDGSWAYSGGKPYECEQCKYSSKTAQNLKTHNLTHSGEKPYACD